MCGIAGIYNFRSNVPVLSETLRLMNDEIIHRGPDDEGYYIKDDIGLSFRRLSIIDLNTGNQPIHNEDNSIWVVFNGEIYNYIELRLELIQKGHNFYTKSDTEVIVHLYEEYGLNFPDHLNGMFAIVLWDIKIKTLFLLRDRVGIKPLYYAETKDGLMFASEIKALLKGGVSKCPDYEAINQYLSYGYIPSPLSGFKSIKKLNSGNILICSEKEYRKKEYWDLHGNRFAQGPDEEQLVDLLTEELKEAVLRQTRSDVPVGIFLSGGIDSALIASVAAKKCNLKLSAFTIGFEEESYDELSNARVITKNLGLDLHEMILSEKEIYDEIDHIVNGIDEPLMDTSIIPTYFVSKFARSRVKTVLAGDGGDELFGGYPTHYIFKITNLYKKIPQFIRNKLKSTINMLPESHSYLSLPYKLKRFTYGSEFPYDEGHFRWKVLFDNDEKQELLSNDFVKEIKSLDSFYVMEKYFERSRSNGDQIQDQLMYVDFKTFLQEAPLQKSDRMSMANSLEVRVPLLDNTIIDFSQNRQIPKIKGFKTKYLLRKALARFQPYEIAFGKKKGFTPPLALWIKSGLKEYMMDTLSKDSLKKIGFLNHDHVSQIINDHVNGRDENSRHIWALIVLVNWNRNYVS